MKISLRLPPTLDFEKATKYTIKELSRDPPFKAKIKCYKNGFKTPTEVWHELSKTRLLYTIYTSLKRPLRNCPYHLFTICIPYLLGIKMRFVISFAIFAM